MGLTYGFNGCLKGCFAHTPFLSIAGEAVFLIDIVWMVWMYDFGFGIVLYMYCGNMWGEYPAYFDHIPDTTSEAI